MLKHTLLPAARLLLVLTVLTGILYPVAMTLAANVLFPAQANGSLIERDGPLPTDQELHDDYVEYLIRKYV